MVQWLFAYGGLMHAANRARSIGATGAATAVVVRGLRRSWACAVPAHGLTSLSLRQDTAAATVGVLVAVTAAQWAALDQREQGYRRIVIEPAALRPFADGGESAVGEVQAYVALREDAPTAAYPITQSEVDAWLGGCLAEYGEPLTRAVIATTDGWGGAWLDDRAAPRYPFGTADEQLQRQVDGLLAGSGWRAG